MTLQRYQVTKLETSLFTLLKPKRYLQGTSKLEIFVNPHLPHSRSPVLSQKLIMKNSSASFSLIILGLFLTLHLTSAASLLKASNVQLPDNLRSKLIKSDIQHSLSSYLSTVSRASTNKVKQCGTIDFASFVQSQSFISCTGCFNDVKLPNGENIPDPSELGLSDISLPGNEECPEDCCVSIKFLSSTSAETIICGTDGCCHRALVHVKGGFEDILSGNVNGIDISTSGVIDFNALSVSLYMIAFLNHIHFNVLQGY